ncbi:hypothetical protein [Mesorhizobium sp. M0019]|uniref:hypothetical protein n=1 Tax=Mesorhizobium sp. M0019 TaxID=2956845 RepID=UPI00333666DF
MDVIVSSLLASFLIVLEKLVVVQDHRRHNAAEADAGAKRVVPKLVKMWRDRPRHDCRRIAAKAVIHGSIAGLEGQTIKVP